MRVTRLYVEGPITENATLELAAPLPAVRHINAVLRLQAGATVTLFNGHGGEYPGELLGVNKTRVQVQVFDHQEIERETLWPLCLALCASKGAKMDLSIQKATELGACRIQPLISSRSVVRMEPERARRRQRHWQEIVISASEQSGRNRIAVINPLRSFDDWLAVGPQEGLKLLFSPTATLPLCRCAGPDASGVWLLIGPEGGLTDREIDAAQRRGFQTVSFGPRILRAETAVIASLAAVTALWGGGLSTELLGQWP